MAQSVVDDGSSETCDKEHLAYLMNHFDQNLCHCGLSRPISWVSSNAREVFLAGKPVLFLSA